jgi:hypothetical protein
VVLALLVATPAHGQPAPAERPVVPVLAGDPAPHDGLLVDDVRMARYLRLETDLTEARGLEAACRKAISDVEHQLAQERERQIQRGWWERNDFWIGAGLGVAATVAFVWAVK